MIDRANAWAPRTLSLLRFMTGLLYLQHGTQKLLHFPPGGHAVPNLMSMMGAAGVLELVGGALITVGLMTRPAAFILSGQMAVAYFMVHLASGKGEPGGFYPVVNGGDLAILFCFVFFYLVFAGPGPWSLDAIRRRRA